VQEATALAEVAIAEEKAKRYLDAPIEKTSLYCPNVAK
jgi:hypothetical protein